MTVTKTIALPSGRTLVGYDLCSGRAISDGSTAQMMNFVEDAKKDIAYLASLSSRSAEAGKPVVKDGHEDHVYERFQSLFDRGRAAGGFEGDTQNLIRELTNALRDAANWRAETKIALQLEQQMRLEAQSRLSALSTPADIEPVAWLRHGEMVPVQGCPLGAMWITDKDDPRGFPVYASPALAAPVADIEPVSVPDGERRQGFYWIKASDGWEPWKWTPKGWTNDFVASYYTDEEIGEIGPYIPFPLAAAPHSTKTEAVDADAVIERCAQIAETFGPSRPIVSVNPDRLVIGRWEGEQAASLSIAASIRALAAQGEKQP